MAPLSAKKNAKVERIKMSSHQTDNRSTEDLWLALDKTFHEIQETRSFSQGFNELYRCAYTMVRRNAGERLYNGLRDAIAKFLAKNVRPVVLAKTGEDFLQELNQAWKDHQQSMAMICDIVMYLDIAYASLNNVDSVDKMGVSVFLDEVACYDDVRDRLCATLLSLVNKEREGGCVDRLAIKQACDMLESLGHGSRSVYEEVFERPFLADTARFYKSQCQNCLLTMSSLAYFDKVEEHIEKESERAKQCLNESTVISIVRVLETELIGECMNDILEKEGPGIKLMLKNWMMEDLAHAFRLVNRVQGGQKSFFKCVSKHLRDIGSLIVREEGDRVGLIPRLIELKSRVDRILRHCFDGDYLAEQVIAKDIEHILSLTEKSPELLSAFVDDTLRRGILRMTDQEIDSLLKKVAEIFGFLPDKDLFVSSYTQHLAKRLLACEDTSYDAEKRVVAKLKNECGCLFTHRLETLFKDLYHSDALTQEFNEAVSSSRMGLNKLHLNVRVLTAGFWPLSWATQPSNIPTVPGKAFETFRRFYLAKYKGRQLTLQPQLGSADMNAVFYGPWEEPSPSRDANSSASKPRTYTIQVSTPQMCVLMLFNNHDKLTFADIASETNFPEKDLMQALHSLCSGKSCGPVLTKTPATEQIEYCHVFAVNDAFTATGKEVKVQPACGRKESASTSCTDTKARIDEERKYNIDTAIVKVMKSRRMLLHENLVIEVTELLRARFTPSPDALKKRVDALIEREYMERETKDPHLYVYIP
ncbi:cullin-3-A [Rhipicephalus microplus]|uniref:cullin-3-A n=1 Tax=Rhipicephalus microplus TaxID=6941 RepID=UPI003F6BAE17